MEIRQLVGLDVGSQRTGIARASALSRLAEPLMTVKTAEAHAKLKDLIEKQAIDAIVVGLPRSLDGKDTEQTQWVRQWVDEAKTRIDKPFYFQDEALTTHLAETQARAHKRSQDPDALAAAIILQDFLDSPEVERALA